MKYVGVWTGILFFLFSSTLFYLSFEYEYYSRVGPGPGLFPAWLSGLLMVVSVIYIIDSFKKAELKLKDILPKGDGLYTVLSIFGSVILFILIAPYSGFMIAGTLMIFILLFREYKWYKSLGISIIVTISIFFVFSTFLGVPLPVNALGW